MVAQLPPTKAVKQDVRKKVNKYAFHDESGGGGGVPNTAAAPAMTNPAAPTFYAAPGSGPMGAPPAQPANPAPPPNSLDHLQGPATMGTPGAAAFAPSVAAPPGTSLNLLQGPQMMGAGTPRPSSMGAAPAPMARSNAPDFGQNSAPSAEQGSKNRIDPNKIPRPPAGFPYQLLEYRTEVSHPDFPVTIPHASADYQVEDCGSANPRFIRLTMGTLPSTKEARNQAAIPVAAIVQPLAQLGPGEEPLPLVDTDGKGPVRCMRCHAYLNTFCRFVENGFKWICCMCSHQNDTPDHHFNQLDHLGYRVDRDERPELSKGTVEYVATETYLARPPMRPAYLFVVDVSQKALQSGLMRQMTETLKTVVSVLPKHARLGLITYDEAVQFHVLAAAGDTLHKLLVATDVDDPFCPHSPDALVPPVGEREEAWELLFELLPTLYPEPPIGTRAYAKSHAFGAAVNFAYEVLKELGGKVIAFTCGRPTVGRGLLMPRDDRSSLGTSEEAKLRCPAFQGELSYTALGDACADHHVPPTPHNICATYTYKFRIQIPHTSVTYALH